MRHAVIDTKTLKVINVVMWDGKSNWQPPKGCTVVPAPRAARGDVYDPEGKQFYKDIKLEILR